MKNKLLALIMVLAFAVSISFAANTDRYYMGTVVKTETITSVVYTWTLTVGADSSDQNHSPVMMIGDCNDSDGYVAAVVSAASDMNIIYHYSADGITWYTAVTPADLDATSSTTKCDTIGIQAGVDDLAFHNARYLIVEEADGSNAIATGEILTMTLHFTKDAAIHNNGQAVDLGYVIKSKPARFTNP